MKTILSWVALLAGEAIIIAAFFLWRGNAPTDIFTLNLVMASILYGVMFVDMLVPWINWKDKAQRQVGSMGIRWFITGLYVILALAVMIVGNWKVNLSFTVQLMLHIGLLFLLLLGFVAMFHASDKVVEIHSQESSHRQGVNDMKRAMMQLKDTAIDCPQLMAIYGDRINNLEEGLRYLSPSNNPEASALEAQFVEVINDINIAAPQFSMNQEKIEAALRRAERIYQNRKGVYSN